MRHDAAQFATVTFALLLLAGASCRVDAQTSGRQRDPFHRQGPAGDLIRRSDGIFASAIVVPQDSGDGLRIDVLVRVSWDFLIFTRSTSMFADSAFQASLEVSIDVRDASDRVLQSSTDRAQAYRSLQQADSTRERYLLFRRSFDVGPGAYVLQIQLEDGESTRERILPLRATVSAVDADSLRIHSAFALAALPRPGADTLRLYGFGSSIPFAEQSVIAVVARAGDAARWNWTILRPRVEADPDTILRVSVPPAMILPAFTAAAGSGPVAEFAFDRTRPGPLRTFVFLPAFDTLDAGQYRLMLTVGDGAQSDTLEQSLRVLWRDMPTSLRDPVLASDVMRYVLTEDEIGELTRLDEEDRLPWIHAWWRKSNTDPKIPYRRRMGEYFRRADVAAVRFQALGVTNGAMTDRGRILILNGEPDDVQRTLGTDNRAEEVWVYTSPAMTYRFVDRNRNGNLRLAQ